MHGARAYDCASFHPSCTGVTVVEVGGFAHLWCPGCRIYANLEAVSVKFKTYEEACISRQPVTEMMSARKASK